MEKIVEIKKNCLGTLSLDAKFNGMRKVQDFIVYPMHEGNETDKIKIQSDTRIGYIDLSTGSVSLCPPQPNGAYFMHLVFAKEVDKLSMSELAGLKFRLVQTAGKEVGNNGMNIVTDNSGAEAVRIFNPAPAN